MITATEKTRMSSLISGLDYEAMVKAGTANIKQSLDKKNQKLQSLKWKQESYRDIYKNLKDFQSKCLDILSPTSIRAQAVMKKNKAESSNNKLKVSASSTATAAEYKITSIQKGTKANLTSTDINSNSIELDFSKANTENTNSVRFTLNGNTQTINFEAGNTEEETKTNFLSALNETYKGISSVSFEFEPNSNNLRIAKNPNDKVAHYFSIDPSKSIGINEKTSNRISSLDKLGSAAFAKKLEGDTFKFSINNVDFEFSKDTKINEIISTVNNSKANAKMSFNSLSQSFKIEAEDGSDKFLKLNQTQGNALNVLFNTDNIPSDAIYGTNAKMTIDGITIENNSNKFNIEGLTIDVSEIDNFTASIDTPEILVKVSKDTSNIKETVKNFIKEYNDLLDKLNEAVSTRRLKNSKGNYYEPLTDEEKEEFEPKEIEKWEEKAKVGLLYGDSTINQIFLNIRSSINSSVGGMTIHSLGIDTSKNLNKYGKLEIIDEEKLDAAIEKNADAIAEFFTNSEKGLGYKLNNVVNAAINTSNKNGSPQGSLVKLAGVQNTNSEKTNLIYSQIENTQKLVDQLNKKYESQTERLWKQYTQLEKFIAQMNEQASMFSSPF